MAYRSFKSGLADAKGTLDEIGIAFIGKRKETAMALHAADEKSHIPFHRFFLLRAEREIHTTITSDVEIRPVTSSPRRTDLASSVL